MSERERMCSSEEVLIDDLEHATNREIRSVASRILHSRLRLQNSPCLKEDSQLYAILRSISAHGGNTEDIRPIRNYDDILNESKEQKDYWSKRGQLCNLLYRLEESKTLYKYNDDSFKKAVKETSKEYIDNEWMHTEYLANYLLQYLILGERANPTYPKATVPLYYSRKLGRFIHVWEYYRLSGVWRFWRFVFWTALVAASIDSALEYFTLPRPSWLGWV